MYDLAAIETALAATAYAGKLHYSHTTGSTNSDALAAARLDAPHGTVYFADAQKAGRGRGDHRWESQAGKGLYVSALLRLALAAERLPLLPLAAGLAAADAVQEISGLAVDLRWPNDLLLGEAKVGGILVESKLDGARLGYAVVGIGINVHQQRFEAELATPATSLALASGRTMSRQALLIALLKSLEREAKGLLARDAGRTVPARLEQHSSWVRGRVVDVHGPQACHGTTAGLDENGFLQVQTETGLVIVQTGGIRAAQAS